MTVRCRWIEETGTARVALRVYEDGPCPRPQGYHDARHELGVAPIARVPDEHGGHWGAPDIEPVDDADLRWPEACGCGHRFGPAARRQVFHEALYRYADADGGGTVTLNEASPGAMWDAWWVPWKGPDGRSIEVICPDGTRWQIDGVASNCNLDPRGRTARDHRREERPHLRGRRRIHRGRWLPRLPPRRRVHVTCTYGATVAHPRGRPRSVRAQRSDHPRARVPRQGMRPA